MFYSQPLATRFGTDLISHINSGNWILLDIAVAWVRASGIAHLVPALTDFLKAGGQLNVVVGIDLDNTTKEGLEGLLALNKHGNVSVFVHHNEAGTIFHPKLYLFRNKTRAKLIVGSNNITEAGLFRNTEAGLEIEAAVGDAIITSATNALDSWRDLSLGLAHQLDNVFLAELVSNGYVMDEASVRAKMASQRRSPATKTGARKKLFGSVSVNPPQKPSTITTAPAARPSGKNKTAASPVSSSMSVTASAIGQVLLMRVRTSRGTQAQIPIREPFFTGVTQVYSVATGIHRGIHATYPARDPSRPNTLKLEMPETRGMIEPVARFERTPVGMQFEVYDSSSAQGQLIMQALNAGRASSPPTTTLTFPSKPASSTWWRII